MLVPTSRNARIALAEGWTWHDKCMIELIPPGAVNFVNPAHWKGPDGVLHLVVPDWVGTLAGCAEMMRQLGSNWRWAFIEDIRKWVCYDNVGPFGVFYSPKNRPGDCIGDAYLSVFEKEGS